MSERRRTTKGRPPRASSMAERRSGARRLITFDQDLVEPTDGRPVGSVTTSACAKSFDSCSSRHRSVRVQVHAQLSQGRRLLFSARKSPESRTTQGNPVIKLTNVRQTLTISTRPHLQWPAPRHRESPASQPRRAAMMPPVAGRCPRARAPGTFKNPHCSLGGGGMRLPFRSRTSPRKDRCRPTTWRDMNGSRRRSLRLPRSVAAHDLAGPTISWM